MHPDPEACGLWVFYILEHTKLQKSNLMALNHSSCTSSTLEIEMLELIPCQLMVYDDVVVLVPNTQIRVAHWICHFHLHHQTSTYQVCLWIRFCLVAHQQQICIVYLLHSYCCLH
nr:hypothetical protein Iba_chr12bCG20090 [Ipomoea batatas]